MKILVVGSSINLGSKSWVALLQKQIDCEVVNLSIVGAANNYVHATTILELSKRSYDLVLPVWNNYKWINFKNYYHAEHINNLNNLNTHQHLVHGKWLTNETKLIDPEAHNQKELLYENYFAFYDNHAKLESSLLNIISLQGFLKSKNIPYVFSFYRKLKYIKRFTHLYNLIDYSDVLDTNLYDVARENDWWDGKHPTVNAHQYYANAMAAYINTMNLAKP